MFWQHCKLRTTWWHEALQKLVVWSQYAVSIMCTAQVTGKRIVNTLFECCPWPRMGKTLSEPSRGGEPQNDFPQLFEHRWGWHCLNRHAHSCWSFFLSARSLRCGPISSCYYHQSHCPSEQQISETWKNNWECAYLVSWNPKLEKKVLCVCTLVNAKSSQNHPGTLPGSSHIPPIPEYKIYIPKYAFLIPRIRRETMRDTPFLRATVSILLQNRSKIVQKSTLVVDLPFCRRLICLGRFFSLCVFWN